MLALTGSAGKTSTKDLLTGILCLAGPTVANVGSFNNEIGFPATVMRAEPGTRYLVLEMDARGKGHINDLTEIVASLAPDGVAVLNGDDPLVRRMTADTRARVILFGAGDDCDVRADDISLGDGGRIRFVLHAFGDTATSPEAVRAALDSLPHIADGRPIVAVLGEMMELGDQAEQIHREIGRLAVTTGVRALVTVGGANAALLGDTARDAGLARVAHVVDREQAVAALDGMLPDRACVFVKGAHSLALEQVADALTSQGDRR